MKYEDIRNIIAEDTMSKGKINVSCLSLLVEHRIG